jgi:hypothetical protein
VKGKKASGKDGLRRKPSPKKGRPLAKVSSKIVSPVVRQTADPESTGRFDEVLSIIEAARRRAYQAVNAELVNL